MILAELVKLYDRLAKDPHTEGLPPLGYALQSVGFTLILDERGNYVATLSELDDKGRPQKWIVPYRKRASGITPNFLCDKFDYFFGVDPRRPKRARQCFEEFKKLHREIQERVDHPLLQALINFLEAWDPDRPKPLELWDEMLQTGFFIAPAVLVKGKVRPIYLHKQKELIEAWWDYRQKELSIGTGACLITGERAPIARMHPSVKGLGGDSSIVAFNFDSVYFFRKKQGGNAPVSVTAAEKYALALSWLLDTSDPSRRRKVQLGDTVAVFWASKKDPLENNFGYLLAFDEVPEDPEVVKCVGEILRVISKGKMPDNVDVANRFFVVGMVRNRARIAIKFWYAGTLGQILENVGKHFADIKIEKQRDDDSDYPSVRELLRELAPRKARARRQDNIPSTLTTEYMRSIICGLRYPESLLAALLDRIRADGGLVNRNRAAMIKGVLVRNFKKEVPMSLDRSRPDPAYRLGRLFAVLEHLQRRAIKDVQATIRDRFFATASANPATVFPYLLRLAQHHLGKLEGGERTFFDKQIQEILEPIPSFPRHLSLPEQGVFVLGYYHQRNELFKGGEKNEEQ